MSSATMKTKSKWELVWDKLGDSSRPIQHRDLRNLSDLGSEVEAELLMGWRLIGVDRRRALVKAMTSLSEDSVARQDMFEIGV